MREQPAVPHPSPLVPRPFALVALDLDGTLLTDDLRITERSRAAIRRARERGVRVPLAPDAARALVAFMRQQHPELNISLECGDRWYIDDLTEEVRGAIERYEVDPPHGVACLEQVLADETEAISKILFRGNMRTAEQLLAAL